MPPDQGVVHPADPGDGRSVECDGVGQPGVPEHAVAADRGVRPDEGVVEQAPGADDGGPLDVGADYPDAALDDDRAGQHAVLVDLALHRVAQVLQDPAVAVPDVPDPARVPPGAA